MTPETPGSFHADTSDRTRPNATRCSRRSACRRIDALIDQTIPPGDPQLCAAGPSRGRHRTRLSSPSSRRSRRATRVARSYIGIGYYDCVTPSVILRNVFENPGWYTPYTPYQAEIAQGRLESLLNFQTVVRDLTGMDIATASLLDEGHGGGRGDDDVPSAAGARRRRSGTGERVSRVGAAASRRRSTCCAAAPNRSTSAWRSAIRRSSSDEALSRAFGLLLQYPDERGGSRRSPADRSSGRTLPGVLVAVATDLLALTLFTPPGEMGADAVVGNSQRFGVPLGCGGPHAAFLATREAYVRQAPGRIIGLSIDARGRQAYRMALQTREQHIRREKATSNICTAQALLANIAAMYAVYHGPEGLRAIASRDSTPRGARTGADGARLPPGERRLLRHAVDGRRRRRRRPPRSGSARDQLPVRASRHWHRARRDVPTTTSRM